MGFEAHHPQCGRERRIEKPLHALVSTGDIGQKPHFDVIRDRADALEDIRRGEIER